MDQVIADTLQQIATSLAAQDARAAEAAAEQRGRFCLGPLSMVILLFLGAPSCWFLPPVVYCLICVFVCSLSLWCGV